MIKKRPFITLLQACVNAKIKTTRNQRMVVGRAWFGMYQLKRKKDRKRYPWVGHVKEGEFKVRAYPVRFEGEMVRFVQNSLKILNGKV